MERRGREMIKNKYYKITLNDEENTTLLMRVRKDFYTEGFIVDKPGLLQGYYDFYIALRLCILTDTDESIFEHYGFVKNRDEDIAYAMLDEELINYGKIDSFSYIEEEITDTKEISNINYLIRNKVKELNNSNQTMYQFLLNKRREHFDEVKSELTEPIYNTKGGSYIPIEDPSFPYTREDLQEIKTYLQSLSELYHPIKGRDEFGNRIRTKKKKNKAAKVKTKKRKEVRT